MCCVGRAPVWLLRLQPGSNWVTGSLPHHLFPPRQGHDDLAKRCAEYRAAGARFAKW